MAEGNITEHFTTSDTANFSELQYIHWRNQERRQEDEINVISNDKRRRRRDFEGKFKFTAQEVGGLIIHTHIFHDVIPPNYTIYKLYYKKCIDQKLKERHIRYRYWVRFIKMYTPSQSNLDKDMINIFLDSVTYAPWGYNYLTCPLWINLLRNQRKKKNLYYNLSELAWELPHF